MSFRAANNLQCPGMLLHACTSEHCGPYAKVPDSQMRPTSILSEKWCRDPSMWLWVRPWYACPCIGWLKPPWSMLNKRPWISCLTLLLAPSPQMPVKRQSPAAQKPTRRYAAAHMFFSYIVHHGVRERVCRFTNMAKQSHSPISSWLVWPLAGCPECWGRLAKLGMRGRHGAPVLWWRFCCSSKGVGARVGPGVLPATK